MEKINTPSSCDPCSTHNASGSVRLSRGQSVARGGGDVCFVCCQQGRHYFIMRFVQRRLKFQPRRPRMPPAAELFGESRDVDLALAAQAHAHGAGVHAAR